MVGSQRSRRSAGSQKLLRLQPVIEGDQTTRMQRGGGPSPPGHRSWASLANKSVGQHRLQFFGQVPLHRRGGWQCYPVEPSLFPAHPLLYPSPLVGAPAPAFHRKSIKQFIGENDPAHPGGHRLAPDHAVTEAGQTLTLPGLTCRTRLNDPVTEALTALAGFTHQRLQDIFRPSAVVSPRLDDFYRPVGQPLRSTDLVLDPIGHQFAKEGSH